jgi:hypothetical protein
VGGLMVAREHGRHHIIRPCVALSNFPWFFPQ